MKKQKNLLLRITILAFALCCITVSVHAQISPQTIKKTFNVRPGGQLTLNSQFGTIDVKVNSRNQVSCIATKAVDPNINMTIGGLTRSELDRLLQEALADFEVTFSPTGSDVLIQGKFKRGWEYWVRHPYATILWMKLKIDFQVTVPRQYNVDLKTGSSGNIRVENIGGKLNAITDYGDIQLGSVTGAVNAKTGSSGNITLKACQSTVEAKSDYGDIQLGNVTGAVNAKTGSSGNITLKGCQSTVEAITDYGDIRSEMTKQMTRPWTLQTSSSGGIVVVLLPNVAIDVDARTSSSGSVSSDFRVQGSISENSIKGTINGGGPLLKMRASYGDIYLRKK